MRYNPRTDRALNIEEINRQCWSAVEKQQAENPAPINFARVWNCGQGGWTTTVR